jgi:hypothetical protein
MARSQATPYVGVDAAFVLTPIGGGSDVTLWNSDWEIDPDGNVAEAPNTTDGMVRAPGLFDYKGSVKGKTNVASTSVSIETLAMSNQIWAFKAYRSKTATTFFAGIIIILTGPKISTGTGTTEEWELSFAKAYGPLTLPNGTTF